MEKDKVTTEQLLADFNEFMHNLDWQKIDDQNVEIVSNRFNLKELPATIQNYIKSYFAYINTID